MAKAMTLRLDDKLAAELEAVARADAIPVSQAVRDALVRHIEERRRDPEFRARIKRLVEEDREILDRLAQ